MGPSVQNVEKMVSGYFKTKKKTMGGGVNALLALPLKKLFAAILTISAKGHCWNNVFLMSS